MKRDVRLTGLSSEHHQALVLARWAERRHGVWTARDGVELARRLDGELEPHFAVEEEVLVPGLREAGAADLAEQTLGDHAFLRERAARARTGDGSAARAFAERLHAHVRFEERELFPACERLLPDALLDEVWRRAPKAPTG